MAHRIELNGPAKYVAVGLVLVVALGGWVAPSLLSSVTGSAGRSFSFLRSGYVEQHKTNLTGHWLTTAKGRYRTRPFFATAGENVTIDHTIDVSEGSVSIRLRRYVLDLVPERVWSHRVRDSADGRLTVDVPATGFYCIELSYFGFAGSVTLDWSVDEAGPSSAF